VGRVHEMQLSANTLASVATIDGAGNNALLGFALSHLQNFKPGSCSAGATLAVGDPGFDPSPDVGPFGIVRLYQKSGATWSLCDTIEPGTTSPYSGWGARLFDLGDAVGDGYNLLAVSGLTYQGGAVRIYGGA